MSRVAVLALVLFAASCGSPAPEPEPLPDNPGAPGFDHSAWDALMKAHVDPQGGVDYGALLDKKAAVAAYVEALGAADWRALPDRSARFAFWINAYNAVCIAMVLDKLPEDRATWSEFTVWGGLLGNPFFDQKQFKVSGELRSLNDIEHKLLRPQFADARLHMAIVCASVSCPPLRNEAFVSERLDAQLDGQARTFVADTSKNVIDAPGKTLKISKIFDWFEKDFVAESGSVPGWIARFAADAKVAEALRSGEWSTEYGTYDKRLNLKR